MLIKQIGLENFMVHDRAVLNIPLTGITLVMGANGSGKSSFGEGVAAMWNRSLRNKKSRKTKGFRKKVAGKVTVTTADDLTIARTCTKSGTLGLTYGHAGKPPVEYTTATKAQAALETEIGTYDLWRRSCFFSSADADGFTSATDSERRALLEELLDLDQFVNAHEIAKTKLKNAEKELVTTGQNRTKYEAQADQLREHLGFVETSIKKLTMPTPLDTSFSVSSAMNELAEAQSALSELEQKKSGQTVLASLIARKETAEAALVELVHPTPPPGGDLVTLRDAWQTLDKEVARLEGDLTAADAVATDAKHTKEVALHKQSCVEKECALLRESHCPTCAQVIGEELKSTLQAKMNDAAATVGAAAKAAEIAAEKAAELRKSTQDVLEKKKLERSRVRDEGTRQKAAQEAHDQAMNLYSKQKLKWSTELDQIQGELAATNIVEFTSQDETEQRKLQERVRELDVAITSAEMERKAYNDAYEAWEKQSSHLTQQRQKYETDLEEVEERRQASVYEELNAQGEVAVAKAGVAILGPKGVRAHVLSQALQGIETICNRWLREFHDSLLISLSPYTDTAKGGSKMSIALKVRNRNEGEDYEDLSGGERRRLDLAMVLALAEVARLAQGVKEWGTLFLDEILDAIDDEGADRVCAAINTLSRERSIVVITHNPAIRSRLRPVQTVVLDAKGYAAE